MESCSMFAFPLNYLENSNIFNGNILGTSKKCGSHSQSGLLQFFETLNLLERALQHESHSISTDEPQTTLRWKVRSFRATSSENQIPLISLPEEGLGLPAGANRVHRISAMKLHLEAPIQILPAMKKTQGQPFI